MLLLLLGSASAVDNYSQTICIIVSKPEVKSAILNTSCGPELIPNCSFCADET